MAEDFSRSVELGLKLSKRIYYGKDESVSAPPRALVAERKTEEVESHLPTAVMVYAEITDPTIVDNPYISSYQPYVHGRCDPPALIPLHMHAVRMEVNCYLDTAFVTVSGSWRVHCVSASESCNCRIALPMGAEGSVLGVEVDTTLNSHRTQVISLEDSKDAEKLSSAKDGLLIKGHTYTLKIPRVDGGSILSLKISWSQKILHQDGQYCLNVPFTFPSYVVPVGSKGFETEKILLNVDSGTGTQVFCKSYSHPLREIRLLAGKVGFSCEREVVTWSTADFNFSYTVSSSDICGGVLLQSPSLHDYDQREMFCFYLYPGNIIHRKIFRKEVIFLVDKSASMKGGPLERAKTALLAALSKLSPLDTFNIISFNGSSSFFSSSMEIATKEVLEKAFEWIHINFVADGVTNISTPLDQAIKMVSRDGDVLPIIFLVTDGTVEDEKDICHALESHLMKGGLISPRICTFGIGSYCNHYFLKMLAEIGRGYYDAAFDMDSINFRMERFINDASSIILSDINVDVLEHLDSLELYSLHLPDLQSGSPLYMFGRYCGNFPNSVKVSGILADMSNLVLNAKVHRAKDVPLHKVFARRQIDSLTAHAWLSGNKQLEEKAAKMSIYTAVPSEYTNMILFETDKRKKQTKSNAVEEEMGGFRGQKPNVLRSLGTGFGNLQATANNLPPEKSEPKLYETSTTLVKAASNVGRRLADRCCLIDAIVHRDGETLWRLTCFYGNPKLADRSASWQLLRRLSSQWTLRWLCCGDFNETLMLNERIGSDSRPASTMDSFRCVIMDCSLEDLGFIGSPMTWNNGRQGAKHIQARLDRAFGNHQRRSIFPLAMVYNLAFSWSDHRPIFIQFHGLAASLGRSAYSTDRPFHFEPYWIRENDYMEVAQSSLFGGSRVASHTNPFASVENILGRCTENLSVWSHKKFQDRKKELIRLMEERDRLLGEDLASSSMDIVKRLESEIEAATMREKMHWRQRARVDWLKDGNANTKYFHSRASKQKRKNTISSLKDANGAWIEEKDDIVRHIKAYYDNLFTSDQPSDPIMEEGVEGMFRALSPDDLAILNNAFTVDEDGKEKTLAMIKPDGVAGNYTDLIKKAISDSGFSITQEMLLELDEETVKSFYAEHASKSFFPGLVQYMLSGPVLIMVLEKGNAIADWRALIGPTDANNAKITHPSSVRAMCGLDLQRNCVHGSDSPQSADREITFFFSKESSGYVWRHDEL